MRSPRSNRRLFTGLATLGASALLMASGPPAWAFHVHTDYPVGEFPTSVAIGDLNRDGLPDLAVVNNIHGSVSVLLGTGGGTFNAQTQFGTLDDPDSIVVGDFN